MKYIYLSVCMVVAIGATGLWPDNPVIGVFCGAIFGMTILLGSIAVYTDTYTRKT